MSGRTIIYCQACFKDKDYKVIAIKRLFHFVRPMTWGCYHLIVTRQDFNVKVERIIK